MTQPSSFPPKDATAGGLFNRVLAERVIENLKARKMNGLFAETGAEAAELALSMIPDGAVVSQGGSMTVDETGLRDRLLAADRFTFKDPYAPGLSKEAAFDLRLATLTCDVFVCSTNALTRDGILVNRDGIGNRVCAMAFGPGKVIILAGLNKIVADVNAAISRIDTVAAPMNCLRLKRETPCSHTLECADCDTEQRICSVTTLIERQWRDDRIYVILIGENLGY